MIPTVGKLDLDVYRALLAEATSLNNSYPRRNLDRTVPT